MCLCLSSFVCVCMCAWQPLHIMVPFNFRISMYVFVHLIIVCICVCACVHMCTVYIAMYVSMFVSFYLGPIALKIASSISLKFFWKAMLTQMLPQTKEPLLSKGFILPVSFSFYSSMVLDLNTKIGTSILVLNSMRHIRPRRHLLLEIQESARAPSQCH